MDSLTSGDENWCREINEFFNIQTNIYYTQMDSLDMWMGRFAFLFMIVLMMIIGTWTSANHMIYVQYDMEYGWI